MHNMFKHWHPNYVLQIKTTKVVWRLSTRKRKITKRALFCKKIFCITVLLEVIKLLIMCIILTLVVAVATLLVIIIENHWVLEYWTLYYTMLYLLVTNLCTTIYSPSLKGNQTKPAQIPTFLMYKWLFKTHRILFLFDLILNKIVVVNGF